MAFLEPKRHSRAIWTSSVSLDVDDDDDGQSSNRSRSPSIGMRGEHQLHEASPHTGSVFIAPTPIQPKKFRESKVIPDFGHDLRVFGVPTAVILLSVLVVELVMRHLPSPVPASAPACEFSEARALAHLNVICEQPRGLSDPGNNATFNYLYDLLQTWKDVETSNPHLMLQLKVVSDIHTTVAKHFTLGGPNLPQYIVSARSIAVRICPRNASTPGVCAPFKSNFMFAANYDTPATSRGAGANGGGVAVMLEVIHNLIQSRRSISNSLVFLFANGVNSYSVPIRTFVKKDPWAKGVLFVGLVWGGGISGKQVMVRPQSSGSLNVYSRVPHPCTSSAISTPFSAGLPSGYDIIGEEIASASGFTLSLFDNTLLAGTVSDTPDLVVPGSLQNAGDNLLAIATQFLTDQTNWREQDPGDDFNNVYFDVLGSFVVSMSSPVYLSTSSTLLFCSIVYVIVRCRADVGSRLNSGVGLLDMRLVSVCFALLTLTALVACVAVGVVAAILTLITILIYAQPKLVVGTFAVWAMLFVFSLQAVVQEKLPVTFRVGPQRWCHHMDIACLLVYVIACIVCTALNRSDTFLAPVWLFATLLRIMITHVLRIIPQPPSRASLNLSPHSNRHNSHNTQHTTETLYTALSDPTTPIPSPSQSHTFPPNSAEHSSSKNLLVPQPTDSNSSGGVSLITLFAALCCCCTGVSQCLFELASKSRMFYRCIFCKCCNFGSPDGWTGRWTKIYFLRSFLRFCRVFFCVFVPCTIHLQTWEMILQSEMFWQHEVLVWATMAVGMIFPLLLVIVPDMHRIRHTYILCSFIGLGAILSLVILFVSRTFTLSRPDIVQMHHVQQEWHTSSIDTEDSTYTYAFVQATDLNELNRNFFPYDLCKFNTVNDVKRCEISSSDPQNFLNITCPKPMVEFRTRMRYSDGSRVIAANIRPGSFVFAIDLTHASVADAKWFGSCDPKNCSISNAQLSPPINLDVTTQNLFIMSDSETRTFYAELTIGPSTMAPMTLQTFYTQSIYSPIFQNLLSNLPSLMTIRGTFFGPAHVESYWYLS